MGYRVRYRKTYVTLPINPRKGVCEACGKSIRKGEIKTTHIHHYKYAYMTKTVKKNPSLALKNTIELDYYCHRIADALRVLSNADNRRIAKVLSVHPKSFIKKVPLFMKMRN